MSILLVKCQPSGLAFERLRLIGLFAKENITFYFIKAFWYFMISFIIKHFVNKMAIKTSDKIGTRKI